MNELGETVALYRTIWLERSRIALPAHQKPLILFRVDQIDSLAGARLVRPAAGLDENRELIRPCEARSPKKTKVSATLP